jgi:hypothetical protein
MATLTKTMTALALILGAPHGTFAVPEARAQTTQPQPSPAYRAEDFMEFVGINGSPIISNIHEDGPFKGAGRTHSPDVFYDLGHSLLSSGLRHSLVREDQPQQVSKPGRRAAHAP